MKRIILAVLLISAWGCSSKNRQPTELMKNGAASSVVSDSLTRSLADSFTRKYASTSQMIYVPVYSHIYQQDHKKTFNLTATLSIRNADVANTLTLTKVLYFDSKGKVVKNYLENPLPIQPLASTSYVIEENDLRGGVGANFIVVWEAANLVYPPVVEAVMISTSQQQGVSFVSQGRVLEDQNSDSLSSQ